MRSRRKEAAFARPLRFALRAGAKKPPIRPTGEVRPASGSRAWARPGNQAREPRRRRHAPAGARAGYARIRVPPLRETGRWKEWNEVERNEVKERHAGLRKQGFGRPDHPNPLAPLAGLPDSHISARWRGVALPQPPALAKAGVAPAPEPGPSLGSHGSPDRGPGQAPAVRPALHRLRRHRKSGMGPRLRGDDEKGGKPAQQGQQARRRQAGMRCVHAVGLRGEAGKGDRTRAAGRDAAQGKNMPPSQAREGGKLRLHA